MAPYLLLGMIFVGIMNTFVTKKMVSDHIGKNNFWSILKASLLGIPLPLCSCGVIPTAVYMANNKASKPAVTSFLISTPQTGVDSIIATYGMMGPVFAIYRPIAALFMGIFGGAIVKSFYKAPKPKMFELNVLSNSDTGEESKSFYEKAIKYPFIEFLDDIAPQLLVGLLIAGVIAFAFPDDFFAEYGLNSGLPAMLLLIAIGVPMYICATASIPIAVALMMKGFSPGAAFVFLAVGPATNVASFTVLVKSLGKKVVSLYVLSIAIGGLAFGLLIDYLFAAMNIDPLEYVSNIHGHEHESLNLISITSSVILGALLLGSIYRIYLAKYFNKAKPTTTNSQILTVNGMTCSHCEATVKDAVEKTGAQVHNISHITSSIEIENGFDQEKVKKAIEEAGYSL